jgi:hypothetical protein
MSRTDGFAGTSDMAGSASEIKRDLVAAGWQNARKCRLPSQGRDDCQKGVQMRLGINSAEDE